MEKALITKYKVGEYVLVKHEIDVGDKIRVSHAFRMTVNGIIKGANVVIKDIESLLGLGAEMKSGCENLKVLLTTVLPLAAKKSMGSKSTYKWGSNYGNLQDMQWKGFREVS